MAVFLALTRIRLGGEAEHKSLICIFTNEVKPITEIIQSCAENTVLGRVMNDTFSPTSYHTAQAAIF